MILLCTITLPEGLPINGGASPGVSPYTDYITCVLSNDIVLFIVNKLFTTCLHVV